MTSHIKEEAIGGLAAGVLGTVIGYPLDLVKTRMQTSSHSTTKGGGIVSTGYDIVRNEGIRALYKGMAPPLISLTILNTTIFTLYGELRTKYNAQVGFDIKNGLAGATAAPVAAIVSTIENFIKTQMQLDNLRQPKRFHNSWHCVTTLVQESKPKQHPFGGGGGIGVLYTGFGINLWRECTFLYTYFYMYEGLRQTLLENAHVNPKLAVPIAGGCSGAMGWFISFPLDCIRAGVQGQDMLSSSKKRATAREVATTLLRSKGIQGLYSGVTPSIARAFLVSGSRFSAYEFAIYLITGKRYHSEED